MTRRSAILAALALGVALSASAPVAAHELVGFDAERAFDPSTTFDSGSDAEQIEIIRTLFGMPDGENGTIVPELMRQAGNLIPPFVFELARRLWESDRDQALEWFAVAVLRSHYDSQRCLDRSTAEDLEAVWFIAGNVIAGIRRDRAAYGRAGLRALARADLLASPASPRWICTQGVQAYGAPPAIPSQPPRPWLSPEPEWGPIAEHLRAHATRVFRQMSEETR